MPTINFAGLASGIDSTSLIEATSAAARKTRVDPSKKKITDLEGTNTSLDELKTKLTTLQTTTRAMASLNGGLLAKQATSTDESKISATASNAAGNGTYDLTVSNLAKNGTYSFTSTGKVYTSSTDTLGAASGNVVITIGSPVTETINLAVDATTTLSSFATAFNAASANAEASVVQVTPGDYRLVISSTSQGTTAGTISVTPSVLPANIWDVSTLDQAEDAEFTMSGISGTISRSTNSVSDLFAGITFNLQALGSAKVSVTDDASTTTSRMQEFIDQFNELVAYLAENNKVTREESGSSITNVFSPLASTRVDDNLLSSLKSDLSTSNYSSGSEIRIFADLGIKTARDGTLEFDTDVFKSAIAKEPTSVNEILKAFGDRVAITGGTIDQFIRFNGLLDLTLTSNKTQITDLNKRISEAESVIARTEETMRAQFARLESTVGRLQNQQSALSSALAGLG